MQNNGFLSEARAINARDQCGEAGKFQTFAAGKIDKSAREQNELTKKLFDKLTTFLASYNKEKGFDIVLSTQLGGNVLYAVDGFDITADVVDRLNQEYQKDNKK